jgi:hypothetical protein
LIYGPAANLHEDAFLPVEAADQVKKIGLQDSAICPQEKQVHPMQQVVVIFSSYGGLAEMGVAIDVTEKNVASLKAVFFDVLLPQP